MQEGKLRKISIPVLKTMLESTIQQFFASDVLIRNGISYEDALQEMIRILIGGIREENDDVPFSASGRNNDVPAERSAMKDNADE